MENSKWKMVNRYLLILFGLLIKQESKLIGIGGFQ
jgi:hypothetical protein